LERRQRIGYCRSHDGTRIAVASIGRGPPILRAAHWLTHVTYDLESPIWRPWLAELSARNRYIRYDQRGCGLSDRSVEEISFPAWLADLEAAADTIDEPRFTLLGMSQGGSLAIAYALKHPERVSRLILIGAYGRGALARAAGDGERLEAETLLNLVKLGWGRDNLAFRQVFTNLFIPGGTSEQHQWWNDLERRSTTPEIAARTIEETYRIDVADLAPRLTVPTLVMHSRNDARVPFEEGRWLAATIPGARFVPLDSANHVLLANEPAWDRFRAELRDFLGEDSERSTQDPIADASLTTSEVQVLRHLAEGLSNPAIAERLGKQEKTVRNQVSSILSKLGVRTRAEAIVLAFRSGMGPPPQH